MSVTAAIASGPADSAAAASSESASESASAADGADVADVRSAPEADGKPLAAAASPWGFKAGLVVGVLLTLAALGIGSPAPVDVLSEEALAQAAQPQNLLSWVSLNLGHSVWFFALVLALYAMNLQQLNRLLRVQPESRRVSELDQLSDVWMHLFVGIGVIWTAVGMRSALQAALGDAGGSSVVDSADNVLRKLVDGGILLALTTTIVGGVGGYLMRLFKTVLVGSRLQELFERQQRSDVQALVAATERIESRLTTGQEGQLGNRQNASPRAVKESDNGYASAH